MIDETILLAARRRFIAIGDDAPLIAATRPLRDLDADFVVVDDRDRVLGSVNTKTDIVRQISHCAGASCRAAPAAMTKVVVSATPAIYCVTSGRSKSDI